MTKSTFRAGSVIDETFANLWARRILMLGVAAISALLGLLVPLASIVEVRSVLAFSAELDARGANVVSVTERNGLPLSGARCGQLSSVPGVENAGGSISAEVGTLAFGSSMPVTVVAATPGFAAIIWPDDPNVAQQTTIAGANLADTLGLVPGGRIAIETSQQRAVIPIGALAAPSNRNPRYDNYLVTVETPVNQISECLIEAEPGALAGIQQLSLVWFKDVDVLAVPFFKPAQEGGTPQNRLDSRLSTFAPLIGGGFVCATLVAFWLFRRSDFALYRMLGLTRQGLVATIMIEFLVVAIAPMGAGILAALLIASDQLRALTVEVAMIDSMRLVALILLAPAIGFTVISLSNPYSVLKGRT